MRSLEVIPKLSFRLLIAALAGCVLLPPLPAQEGAGKASPAYLNPSLPIELRVDDLISQMTLQEKVLQMQHTAPAIPRLGVPLAVTRA